MSETPNSPEAAASGPQTRPHHASEVYRMGQGASQVVETEFERPRGIHTIEVRNGYTRVSVEPLKEPLAESRMAVLADVARSGISIDFLKLSHRGLSFLVTTLQADQVSDALQEWSGLTVEKGRSVVIVHAVNMRDEEGLIARIVSQAIRSSASLEHLGDMHDRVFLVVPDEDVAGLESRIRTRLMEAQT